MDIRPLTSVVSITDLVMEFPTDKGTFRAVNNVSFQCSSDETVGIIGESGSGKSTLAMAIGGINRAGIHPRSGSVVTLGRDVFRLAGADRRRFLSHEIGFVFQNPVTSLDPTRRIGHQFYTDAGLMFREEIEALLASVGIKDANRVLSAYPHEVSGGMAQRICIAMAISGKPRLLVADEPTSALDAAVRQRILDLLTDIRARTKATLIVVTHDLRAIRKYCDRICVMHAGKIVESGPSEAVMDNPQHGHTQSLMRAIQSMVPRSSHKGSAAPVAARPVVELTNISVRFQKGPPWARTNHDAVREASLAIREGETLGLVGESGSGKSTIGRVSIGLLRQSSGVAALDGTALYGLGKAKPGILGAVLQHPEWSLDPTMTIERSIAEPLKLVDRLSRDERSDRVTEILKSVGLNVDLRTRYPWELSGGQRQRASIARALITHPRFILFDEAVSALDMSIQVQILELIKALQDSARFAALFISHDMAAVCSIAERIIVLRSGKIIEEGLSSEFYRPMNDPYTRHLQYASGLIAENESNNSFTHRGQLHGLA